LVIGYDLRALGSGFNQNFGVQGSRYRGQGYSSLRFRIQDIHIGYRIQLALEISDLKDAFRETLSGRRYPGDAIPKPHSGRSNLN